MKLIAKVVDDCPSIPGDTALLLFDEAGQPLPGQVGTKLKCANGQYNRITVAFEIDGDHIKLEAP